MKRPLLAALPLLLYARRMLADVGLPAKAGDGGDGQRPFPPADGFEIAGGEFVPVDAAQDQEPVDAGAVGPCDIGAQRIPHRQDAPAVADAEEREALLIDGRMGLAEVVHLAAKGL